MPTKKLNVYEFGERLLGTNDLDPVYVLLWEARLERKKLLRWLLAYWCFYHVGTASWIVDNPHGFWFGMEVAAGSKKYPRCHERRHFRGNLATKSVAYLRERGIDGLFGGLLQVHARLSLQDVMKWVGEWYGFGPWIAFKVADMLERLDLVAVDFDPETVFLFDSPQEGARRLYEAERRSLTASERIDEGSPTELARYAVRAILGRLGGRTAPPRYERPFGIPEAETVLCKWKSYLNGSYEVGEDVSGARRCLLRFGKSRTSQTLLRAGKAGGLW